MSRFKQKITQIPHQPGCYLFKNKSGKILYIGKAKDLKKRVSSYFQKNLLDPKTKKLVSELIDVDFIITDTEVEALLLEAKLIKENQPHYNMELKGGVRYAYIRITDEAFPRLETVRNIKRKDKVFGPYALAQTRKNLISLANNLFKLRIGKRKPVKVRDRYQIRCSVPPWNRLVTEDEYKKDIAKAELLLRGKMTELIGQLQQEMNDFSDRQQYELAKLRRNQIRALENLKQEQKIQLRKAYDQDVINYVRIPNTFIVQLFNITKGVVSGRKEFKFSALKTDPDDELLFNFLTQYYYRNEIPQEIIIPQKISDQKLLAKYLTKLSGRKVTVIVPQRGNKAKLLELVKKNIVAGLERGDSALFELQTQLSLPTLPRVIECFDVSNLGPSQIVGSMVHFKDGVPDKNNYRRFKIKWQAEQSDFDAMREIVFRRYYRVKLEHSQRPDLILIDGGKPQLSAARAALRELGVALPVVALAKKQEELFLPGQRYPIRLSRQSDALKMVQKIRDEAHRFAITYHRLLRRKNFEKTPF